MAMPVVRTFFFPLEPHHRWLEMEKSLGQRVASDKWSSRSVVHYWRRVHVVNLVLHWAVSSMNLTGSVDVNESLLWAWWLGALNNAWVKLVYAQ